MASFASLADFRALLGRDFAAEEQASAQLALDLATAAIQNYTRQHLALVTNDVAVLSGNVSRVLVLPERPVVSVASVVLNGTPIAAAGYMLVRNELWWGAGPLNIANQTENLGFGWGTKSTPLSVTYTHGFAVIPDDIRLVCVYMAHRAFTNPVPVSLEQIGGYQVSYGGATGGMELAPLEEEMLKRYRKTWL